MKIKRIPPPVVTDSINVFTCTILMLLFTLPTYSQSGEKWASNGNAVTPGSFLGTTNNNPLLFKANNNLFLTLNTNGEILVKNFAAIDSGLVAFDINGKLIPYPIPHNDKYVLLGNGKWGPLPIPNNYWKLDNTTNHLYTLTTGNVGIGTQTPVMKLDVNGDAIIRGYLYVDNGVIIGKRIESKTVDSDTLRVNDILTSKQMYSDSLSTIKVDAENLNASKAAAIGGRIFIDGPTSSIYSGSNQISFRSSDITTTGNITATSITAQNLLLPAGTFTYLNVSKQIKVGANTLILENDPGGLHNSIYTHGTAQNEDLFIQSTDFNDNNTIINYNNEGNVGIGTDNPTKKLHVKHTRDNSGNPPDDPTEFTGSLRLELELSSGQGTVWDIEPALSAISTVPSKLYFNSVGGSATPVMTLFSNNNVSIGAQSFDQSRLYVRNISSFGGIMSSNTANSAYAFCAEVENENTKAFVLRNNNQEKMVILGNGRVGIGTVTPNAMLHVAGSGIVTENLSIGTLNPNPNSKLHVAGNGLFNGKVGIGTSSVNSNAMLNVEGSSILNGSLCVGTQNQTQSAMIQVESNNTNGYGIYVNALNGSGIVSNVFADNYIAYSARSGGAENFVVTGGGYVFARHVKVTVNSFWDCVFEKDYKLMPLDELKHFVTTNHRLPDLPSEKTVLKEGLDVGEMNSLLVKKVEELTLYVIQLQEQINELKNQNGGK